MNEASKAFFKKSKKKRTTGLVHALQTADKKKKKGNPGCNPSTASGAKRVRKKVTPNGAPKLTKRAKERLERDEKERQERADLERQKQMLLEQARQQNADWAVHADNS